MLRSRPILRSGSKGFTLLEILISISIAASVSILIAQVFFTTSRTNTKTELLKDVKQKTRSLEIRPIGVPGESLAIVDGGVPVIDEKTKILLIEAMQDTKGQICVSKFLGQQVRIETNNGKYFDFEEALIKLERSLWIRKADDEGRLFTLTDLGYQEAAKFKTVEG